MTTQEAYLLDRYYDLMQEIGELGEHVLDAAAFMEIAFRAFRTSYPSAVEFINAAEADQREYLTKLDKVSSSFIVNGKIVDARYFGSALVQLYVGAMACREQQVVELVAEAMERIYRESAQQWWEA